MVGALIIGTLHLNAGNTDFGMEYTTEMQTDFRKKVNWVNLLRTDFTYSPVRNISFAMATVSISETTADGLMDGRLTFSNIEEDSIGSCCDRAGMEKRCFCTFHRCQKSE